MNPRLSSHYKSVYKEIEYTEEDFDDYIDDCYGDVKIGNLSFSSSEVLKEMDPVAYNIEFSEYESSMKKDDEDGWECQWCNRIYETEEDADDCCSYNKDWACSECDTVYDDKHEATICCMSENDKLNRKRV